MQISETHGMKLNKPKRGDRYLNHLGEYCIVKSVYRNIIRLQICGDKARTEPWKMKDFQKQYDKFWIVPFPKSNRTNIARHLLEYQLNIIGKTTANTKENPDWFEEWKISEEDQEIFRQYSINALKKVFKFNTTKAIETFEWWRSWKEGRDGMEIIPIVLYVARTVVIITILNKIL